MSTPKETVTEAYRLARKADHRWPAAKFAGLAKALPVRSITFWGPGEEDLAREVAAQSGAELAPATNLEELASAFRGRRTSVRAPDGFHLSAPGIHIAAPILERQLRRDGLVR